jgi:ABC-type transport system involved in multi-copper enzyme maturation permease subunit
VTVAKGTAPEGEPSPRGSGGRGTATTGRSDPARVHDLGYKRYVGTRRPQSTRWRVIARNVMRHAWKGFWRFKLPLLVAAINTTVFGVLISNEKFMTLGRRVVASPEDVMLFASYADLGWYCRAAFFCTLLTAAGSVASDTQSGAFSFYFARPVRTIDYVIGKLAGYWFLLAVLLVGAPLILAGIRIGMYGDGESALRHADLLGKVIGIGLLGSLAFAAVPLAISALVPNRRYALALWATYYLVVGNIIALVGARNAPVIAMLDIPTAIKTMAYHSFDFQIADSRIPSLPSAVAGLLLHSGAAVALLYARVAQARSSGVGGAG